MSFQCQELPDGSVALRGELDVNHARDAKEALCSLLQRARSGAVDLSGVTEIDFAGVQLLLATRQAAEGLRRELSFAQPSPAVGEAFELLGIRLAGSAEGAARGR